jgi:hypothetical protein
MADSMRIEFEWLDRQFGSDIDRAFFAAIGLVIGEEYLTRIEDIGARTVRNHMHGSAWRLATWFAANWWRLRWEPCLWGTDADWRMAHNIAAAGGGYVWPDAIFASDGDYVEIASSDKIKDAVFEPIRYINHVSGRITATEFEQRVDGFIQGVLSRLESLGLKEEGLPGLWAEVLAERSEPKATERRKLEAMAGFDPDGAPDELLAQLFRNQDILGKYAIEEVTAEARHATADVLKPIREIGGSNGAPQTGGFRVAIPDLKVSQSGSDVDDQPWQRAAKLARLARRQWGFGNGPIKNKALAELLGVASKTLTDTSVVPTKIPFALRSGNKRTLDIFFNKPLSTTRRFTISRIIGDHLNFTDREWLLPATYAKTSRQKFQRAFAQEFLCPIDALLDRIQSEEPNEDAISDAATHFHVSPLMVRTTLVNHHELDREALTWGD